MNSFTLDWELYSYITYAWLLVGLIVFLTLFFKTAPYGRNTVKSWGPLISNRLGWFLMEFPVLLFMATQLIWANKALNPMVWIFVAFFAFHYVNRSLIFPLRLNTKGKKMPLAIACSAIFFNLMNGSLMGYYFAHFAEQTLEWMWDPRFIVGSILFITGVAINWQSDNLLIRLRKPGETGYKIPQGGFFRWVSFPNYFGEIIEWTGFAILTWSLPGLSFLLWSCANLVPRAISNHKWYLNQFPDYPKERKAVFPFLV